MRNGGRYVRGGGDGRWSRRQLQKGACIRASDLSAKIKGSAYVLAGGFERPLCCRAVAPAKRAMEDSIDTTSVRAALRKNAPDLRPHAVDVLARMYSEPRLLGTESPEPVELQPKVRISIEEGANLYNLVRDRGLNSTIEIGFAYGFSTVWLLEALAATGAERHVAIDPYEKDVWRGVGLKQAELLDSGVAAEWICDSSVFALPDLIRRGHKADFIFIDSQHIFDEMLVEFYFADKLLTVGGLVAFDDMWMPAIRSVTNFVLRNRRYEVVRQPVKNLLVLRKAAEDERAWDQFRSFKTAEFLPQRLARTIKRTLSSARG